MNAPLDRNRWKITDDQFAVSFVVDDVPGWFSKPIIVEPGTRALIVDDGEYLGEVPPGSYSLQSFTERLKFWKRKQATVVLTRQEDFPLQVPSNRVSGTKPILVSTKESLSVAASIRVTVQIEDVALFLKNLKGAKEVYTVVDLERHLRPLLVQALWESVGRYSITELTSPEAREQMDAAMEYALSLSFKRYGIRFVQVQLVALRHKDYEFHRDKVGQSWIREQELEQLEKDNDLDVLAANIAVDREEALLEPQKRRIALRNELLEAVRSKEFDKITHKEELAAFLQERDKAKLLRKEEITELIEGYQSRKHDRESARKHLLETIRMQQKYEQESQRQNLGHDLRLDRMQKRIALQDELVKAVRSRQFDKIEHKEDLQAFLQEHDKAKLLRKEETTELVEGYQNRKHDRESARKHLLATLRLQRRYEQETLRQDLGHNLRLKRLDHEIELATSRESKDNLLWKQQVEKDRREVEHRYQQQDKDLQQKRVWALRQTEERRDDEWDELIHQERMQRQADEMQFSRAQREQRLTLLKSELDGDLEAKRLELEKRRKQQELELAAQEGENQLQKLAAVQELNLQASQKQMELTQQQQRLDAELADLSADKAHLREIAKLNALNAVSSDVLIATSDARQSEALADLKKHEASQQTAVSDQVTDSKIAQERARIQQEMMDKLLAAEQSKTAAHRENKSDMHELLKESISSGSGKSAETRRCACGAENPRTSVFCGTCGGRLAGG